MKALILSDYKKLDLVDMQKPRPCDDGLLIRVHACGICGSDVHGYDGSTGRRLPPIVMGHEAAGIVEAVGGAVTGFSSGRSCYVRLHRLLRQSASTAAEAW